jgi:DNA repair protein RecN (Recombination protein N)
VKPGPASPSSSTPWAWPRARAPTPAWSARAAGQASATAIFALPADHPAFAYLDDKGLDYGRDEDLVLRRQLSPDGRSRAFVNDQATSVGVLKDLGALLLEVHGQHETVGLLDPRTHRSLLDAFGACPSRPVASAWSGWRAAREKAEALRDLANRAAAETEELTLRLSELDRLDPREGEETALAEERALLGSAEKAWPTSPRPRTPWAATPCRASWPRPSAPWSGPVSAPCTPARPPTARP